MVQNVWGGLKIIQREYTSYCHIKLLKKKASYAQGRRHEPTAEERRHGAVRVPLRATWQLPNDGRTSYEASTSMKAQLIKDNVNSTFILLK